MSTSENPSDSDPGAPAARKPPWGWIAVAGLLAAAVVGLGIYAVSLNSDLDDANAKIASQQAQIDKAQGTGADVAAAAKSAYDALSAKLGAAQEDANQVVEQASDSLDQAEQAAADAKGTGEELQKDADAARAKAETAATCAKSFLSAFDGVFSAPTLDEGVQATVEELQALEPQCAAALGQE